MRSQDPDLLVLEHVSHPLQMRREHPAHSCTAVEVVSPSTNCYGTRLVVSSRGVSVSPARPLCQCEESEAQGQHIQTPQGDGILLCAYYVLRNFVF